MCGNGMIVQVFLVSYIKVAQKINLQRKCFMTFQN